MTDYVVSSNFLIFYELTIDILGIMCNNNPHALVES